MERVDTLIIRRTYSNVFVTFVQNCQNCFRVPLSMPLATLVQQYYYPFRVPYAVEHQLALLALLMLNNSCGKVVQGYLKLCV